MMAGVTFLGCGKKNQSAPGEKLLDDKFAKEVVLSVNDDDLKIYAFERPTKDSPINRWTRKIVKFHVNYKDIDCDPRTKTPVYCGKKAAWRQSYYTYQLTIPFIAFHEVRVTAIEVEDTDHHVLIDIPFNLRSDCERNGHTAQECVGKPDEYEFFKSYFYFNAVVVITADGSVAPIYQDDVDMVYNPDGMVPAYFKK